MAEPRLSDIDLAALRRSARDLSDIPQREIDRIRAGHASAYAEAERIHEFGLGLQGDGPRRPVL